MRFTGFLRGSLLLAAALAFGCAAVAAQDLPSAPSAVAHPQPPAASPPRSAASPPTSQPGASQPPGAQQPVQPAELAPPKNSPQPATAPPASDSSAANHVPPAPANAAAKTAPPSAIAAATVPTNPAETIKIPVNEVNVIFTATDKHGHFIKNLQAADIHVVDDHQPVPKFTSFSNQTGLPLRVGLLIDASNSIRDRFKFEQQAAIEFLNEIIRPKSDQAFVLGFDTVSEVTQDFTNDTEKLADGLRELRPGGGTALYDALYYACRDKLMKAAPGEAVRRAVILVSDGDDNQSRVTRSEAIEMAERADVIVYTISTNTAPNEMPGDRVLQLIANQTGGRFFAPFKIEDVANAFAEIQDELRSQYAVAYKPPDFKPDGSYRPIEISAVHHGIRIRARKGYYAPLAR